MAGHRASRALGSSVVSVTAVAGAAVAGTSQVLPANPSAGARSAVNKTNATVQIFLCGLGDILGAPGGKNQGPTVELGAGGYWEDPANYQGPITIQGGTSGSVYFTEWQ